MVDLETRTEEQEARTGAGPPEEPPAEKSGRGPRPWMIILAVLAGILVYGLAFQETEVDLEQITSETRQASLTRILRALAQPDLVTYDTERTEVATEIAVPCGPPVGTSDRLTLSPDCADPGSTVTVEGTGFTPGLDAAVEFVPDSEFDITLRLAETRIDDEGNFTVDVEIPERISDQPQEIIAVTEEPIGSWGDREVVYTDANENNQEDDPILGDTGTRTVSIEGQTEVPAVALVDPANTPIDFLSTGEAFEAVSGLANGETAIPLEESTRDTGVRIEAIEPADGGVDVTVVGPPGTDLGGWRIALYDAVTGETIETSFVTDTIELSPRISDTAILSVDKIFETVFLALIATTAGVLLAVPFSFIAARNLMRDISVTVTNLALTMLAIPLGLFAGAGIANLIRDLSEPLVTSSLGALAGALVASGAAYLIVRSTISGEDVVPTPGERARRIVLLALSGILGLAALLLLAVFLEDIGNGLNAALGRFGFIGTFFSSIGEILDVAFVIISAIATAGLAANLAARLGYAIRSRSPRPVVRGLNVVLAAGAGALWAIIIGQIIDWFYQIQDPTFTVMIPGIAGAILGVLVAAKGMRQGEVAIGLSVYYISRTIFNTLRSIEPLVMAIVFVVWVGLGPFAGSLALALHTTAALAKLYSEQVESILPGPIEAVRATGANRVQTIVYAVIPQIVPPYISFTMYRWDINVRMSTILGFVGGGGIGSILQQNINLVEYRAAAVQMLAIAIVVASMDYASSRLRERFV